MNKKNINAQLCRVFDDFVNSIDDKKVQELIKKGTIITGGALVSMLQGEKPNDYDLYFKDFATCFEVAKYFVERFNSENSGRKAIIKILNAREVDNSEIKWIEYNDAKTQCQNGLEPRIKVFIRSSGVAGDIDEYEDNEMETNIELNTDIEKELKEEKKYIPKFLTSNAISLSGKIQLVIRFYGEPDKLHENYDFVHCTNYWTSWDRKVILQLAALEAIVNKELIYIGSKYPLCSIIRTRKFINRGWKINAGQYLKMCMQLNELNLKDIRVLEDQLVGVDSLYFQMLISALQDKKIKDPCFEVNNSYVATIIDKIF